MNKEKTLIICAVVIILTCLIASFAITNHNNSKENNLKDSTNNSLENTSAASNEFIPPDENYHQYAADWYESYHFGGRYHGPHSGEFIATHDIFALAETPDGTYIIVAGDGCYYYVD